MKQFIILHFQVLADDGILITEDVQSWDWIDILKNIVPELCECVKMRLQMRL